jgi:DivIVA domain-containing protein
MSPLTPLDIRGKEFTRDTGGYAMDEVDAFLDMATEQFSRLRDENAHLRDQLTGRIPRIPLGPQRGSLPSFDKRKQFTKAATGYSISEVEAFLDQLTTEFSMLQEQNASLREQLAGLGPSVPSPPSGAPLGTSGAPVVDASGDLVDIIQSPEDVRSALSSYRAAVERSQQLSSGESPSSEEQTPIGGASSPTPRLGMTPLDIQHKEFTKAMRGYAMHEVDTFLDHVTEEFTRMQEEITRLRKELTDLQARTPQQTVTEPERQAHSTRRSSSRRWRPTSQGRERIRRPGVSSPDPKVVETMRRYITDFPPATCPVQSSGPTCKPRASQ